MIGLARKLGFRTWREAGDATLTDLRWAVQDDHHDDALPQAAAEVPFLSDEEALWGLLLS